jgi:uncharacterized membrane protein (UPF0127 family)
MLGVRLMLFPMKIVYFHNCIAWTFIALTISLLTPKLNACPYRLPQTTIAIKGQELAVEIAHTPDTRMCGLSNRQTLAENGGMLFIFPNSRPRTFWMKDTFIPLSIAFLNEAGQIVRIHAMQADQTHITYSSIEPARYALEVNQGWFSLHDIKPGDTVELDLPGVLIIR